mmetsp:Transcript_56405/g.155014  ORF Transcript_56405/g.155014 Transcript_56405/m.155014 type:complete len:276 (+) Transcript_56405:288-1115(+)
MVEHAEGQLVAVLEGLLVEKPIDHHHVARLVRCREGLSHLPRLAHLHLLRVDAARLLRGLREAGEVRVQQLEADQRVVVAVEEDARVGRVVEGVVEASELVERERRDDGRVAARVDRVRVVGEGRLLRRAVHARLGRRVHALHLVEHDSLVHERRRRVLKLVVPPLLRQDCRVLLGARVQHGVKVHVDKVVEVLGVLRGDGVAGAVGVGERVEERLQRALEQLDERLLGRVLVRTAQHRVLENVRHASRIGDGRREDDAEDLVVVIGLRRDHLRA